MAGEVPYAKQTLQTPNPIARFAHQRRHNKAVELAAGLLPHGARLLDFGCGLGDFLNTLSVVRPDATLYGFDPHSGHQGENYVAVDSIDDSLRNSIDVFTCFETLEHLTEGELADFTATVKQLLKPEGALLISVPVIGGPTLLLKEANRAFLHRHRSDYSARELAAAAILGKPAPRTPDVKTSHKGFDFQSLRSRLDADFANGYTTYAPFQVLPWYLNSQVFFTYGLRNDQAMFT